MAVGDLSAPAVAESSEADRRRPLLAPKDLVWLLYLYPVRFCVQRMPLPLLRAIGEAATPFVELLLQRSRKALEGELSSRLGLNAAGGQARQIARRCLANAVRRLLDDLVLEAGMAPGRLRPAEITGLEHLEGARRAGRGVMVVSGHFYATRLAKRYLAELGYPMLSVRHGAPPDTQMGRLGSKWLQKRYVDFLHRVIRDEVFLQDPECTLKVFARLRSGGLVHVHIDAPFSRDEVRLPFLGRLRRFPAGFLRIVRLSGCALVPMLCLGDRSRFAIRFDEPVRLIDGASHEEFIARNLPALVRRLEAQILEYPDQWDAWRIRR